MKNLLQLILSLSALTIAGNVACAQESGSPSFENYDTEHLRESDRILSTPGELEDPQKPPAQQPPVVQQGRDSVSVKTPQRNVFKPAPVVPKDESKPQNQSDDSILSFNFLYYLIQKYKMQDILE